MKFLIAILFAIPNLVYSQNLTLSELISISLKSSEELEEIMLEKEWELFDVESEGMYEVFTYAYNKVRQSDQAEGFLQVSVVNGEWPLSFRERNRKLVLQFTEPLLMKTMRAEIKKLGYTLEKSTVLNGEHQRYYLTKSKKTHIVLTTAGSNKPGLNNTTMYYVAIYAPTNYGSAYGALDTQ